MKLKKPIYTKKPKNIIETSRKMPKCHGKKNSSK